MTTATDTGAAIINTELGPLTEDEAAEELLRRFQLPAEGEDAKKPSSEKTDEDKKSTKPETEAEDKPSAEEPEGEEEAEAEEDTEEEAERKYADDEGAYVKIKVGEEEHEVSVSELKRLWGQESALTQKSMQVAEQRKTVDAEQAKTTASTAALLERAKARFEPFSKLDFNLLATQLQPEEYTQLRQSAQAAWEDVQFLEKNLDAFMRGIQEKQQGDLRERAKESIKILEGPADKGGIEGWDQKLYDDIRAFAMSQGAPAEMVNQIVDPWAIKLMHSAMLFERGKIKGKDSTVVVKKVNKTPKKITKTTTPPAVTKAETGSTVDAQKAMRKLQLTGSTDDAAALFEARWAQESD